MKKVPIEQWGRDHWSLLAFVEWLCVNHQGALSVAHRRNLRCNPKTHPGNCSMAQSAICGWKPTYGTRLKGYYVPGGGVDLRRQIKNHDDWDCLEDMEAAGVLQNKGTGMNPVFWLTERGIDLAAQVGAHKMRGDNFAGFQPDSKTPIPGATAARSAGRRSPAPSRTGPASSSAPVSRDCARR
jgi:hypothetical protein